VQPEVANGGNLEMKEERNVEKQVCNCCKEEFPQEVMVKFEGRWFCGHCLCRETVICTRCGERLWLENNAGNAGLPLCTSCYESYYTDCTDCGRLIHRDDACYYDDDPYCQS
jgi:formylmethanofuran dehydrogenase subunit E